MFLTKKLGLVFSGENIRALVRVGLLETLDENGIQPSIIPGTSGGALVGGLYACGVALEQMLGSFKKMPVFKWLMLTFKKIGLVDSGRYMRFFQKYFKYPTFEDLRIPLSVAATNLLTGKTKYFSEDELVQPLTASSALPPYSSLVKIGDGLCSDGGLLDNLPMEPIRKRCEVIIGGFISPLEVIVENELTSSFHSIQRTYSIAMGSNYSRKFEECNHVFFHNLGNIGVFDAKMLRRAHQYGYEQTNEQIELIKSLVVTDQPVDKLAD